MEIETEQNNLSFIDYAFKKLKCASHRNEKKNLFHIKEEKENNFLFHNQFQITLRRIIKIFEFTILKKQQQNNSFLFFTFLR